MKVNSEKVNKHTAEARVIAIINRFERLRHLANKDNNYNLTITIACACVRDYKLEHTKGLHCCYATLQDSTFSMVMEYSKPETKLIT